MSALAAHTVELVALTEAEIGIAVRALRDYTGHGFATSDDDLTRANDQLPAELLADRLQFGEEYLNELDEFVRLKAHKALIAAAAKKTDGRLAALEAMLIEDFAASGEAGRKHAASGKTVSISRRIWARIKKADPDRKEILPAERQAACDALQAAGLGDFVRDDFSVQSLSAHFGELAKQHTEEQLAVPPEQRTPLNVAALLPEACVGVIDLNDKPTLSVRS